MLFSEILDQAKGKIVTENVCLFYTCPRLHKNNRFSSFLYEWFNSSFNVFFILIAMIHENVFFKITNPIFCTRKLLIIIKSNKGNSSHANKTSKFVLECEQHVIFRIYIVCHVILLLLMRLHNCGPLPFRVTAAKSNRSIALYFVCKGTRNY